jgi:hypothetical protein
MPDLPPNDRRDVERRQAERRTCAHEPLLRFVPKSGFQPLQGRVKDVSTKGIGLVCEEPFGVGTLLALQWHFGACDQWKTVLAHVIHVTPQPDGDVLVGCQFADPLTQPEVDAMLTGGRTAGPHRIRRAVLSVDFLSTLQDGITRTS